MEILAQDRIIFSNAAIIDELSKYAGLYVVTADDNDIVGLFVNPAAAQVVAEVFHTPARAHRLDRDAITVCNIGQLVRHLYSLYLIHDADYFDLVESTAPLCDEVSAMAVVSLVGFCPTQEAASAMAAALKTATGSEYRAIKPAAKHPKPDKAVECLWTAMQDATEVGADHA